MEKSHSWPNGPLLELLVLIGDPLVDIVNRHSNLAFVHVEQDAQHALLLELFVPKWLPIRSIAVAQLPIAVESPAESIVAKGGLKVEVSILANADFEFIFGARIRHDLPVVNTLIEAFVGDDWAEQVLLLLQEEWSVNWAHLDNVRRIVRIPSEVLDGRALLTSDETRWADLIFLENGHGLWDPVIAFILLLEANR